MLSPFLLFNLYMNGLSMLLMKQHPLDAAAIQLLINSCMLMTLYYLLHWLRSCKDC